MDISGPPGLVPSLSQNTCFLLTKISLGSFINILLTHHLGKIIFKARYREYHVSHLTHHALCLQSAVTYNEANSVIFMSK